MEIVIASQNPVKVAATRAAFAALLPDADFTVTACSVPSEVAAQPFSDQETRQGARNRVSNARARHPQAAYWVGLEGGLETIGGCLQAFAWMAVQDGAGRSSEARSATLPLPAAIKALVDAGMELGDANDRVFATHNSKQAGGAFGLLSGGLLTRESVYSETLVLALLPLLKEVYR